MGIIAHGKLILLGNRLGNLAKGDGASRSAEPSGIRLRITFF